MALAVNVVLDLILIPFFGAYGAAFATTVAFSIYVGGHVSLTWELLGGSSSVRPAPAVVRRVILTVGAALTGAVFAAALMLGLEQVVHASIAVFAAGGIAFGMYVVGARRIWRSIPDNELLVKPLN
jgi:peptidoglycan biosynthesis protein MviN/MurJ (putative lipid II flippase)